MSISHERMNIPETVAIIMDGNGRWAKKQGLPRTAGHKKGADQIRTIALEANRLHIKNSFCTPSPRKTGKDRKKRSVIYASCPEYSFPGLLKS